MSQALQKNLRSSHFNMGNSEQEKSSTANDSYKKFALTDDVKKEQQKLAEKMRGVNFSYGHGAGPEKVETTYTSISRNTNPNDYLKSGDS